jgi:hypothetical protein
LKDVINGKADSEKLWALLKESNAGDMSPEELIAVVDDYRSKMDFADAFLIKGTMYLGYDSKSVDTELKQSKEDGAYVFNFSKKSMADLGRKKVVGAPQIAGCAAFTSGTCDTCQHNWLKHLHICYELQDKQVTVVDSRIQEQVAAKATDIKLK